MKGKFSFTTIIVFFVISVGLPCGGFCEDSNSTGNSNTIELIPLEVGNYWVYEEKEFDENNSVTKSDRDTVLISFETSSNNETWFKAEKVNSYRSNLSDGLHDGYIIPFIGISTFLLYKYPASPSDVWEVEVHGGGNGAYELHWKR